MGETRDHNGVQPVDVFDNWPRLPNGVHIHETVDLTLNDPAAVDYTVNAGHAKNARRRCVATRLDEQRCAPEP